MPEQIPVNWPSTLTLIWGRGDHPQSKLSPQRPFTQRESVVRELEGQGRYSVPPVPNSSCCWRWDKGYQLPGAAERKCCILMLRAAAVAANRHTDLNMSSGRHQRPFWSQCKWNADRKWSKDAWHWCRHLRQKNTHYLTIPVVYRDSLSLCSYFCWIHS